MRTTQPCVRLRVANRGGIVAAFFWLLVAVSLLIALVGFRLHYWQLLVIASVLSLPISLVANVDYGGLVLLPALQLACAVSLRWRVGVVGWLGLLLTAVIVWFVGMASPFVLHWPTQIFVVLLTGLVVGFVALIWQQPPWAHRGSR